MIIGVKWMKKNFIMLGISFTLLFIAIIALRLHFSEDKTPVSDLELMQIPAEGDLAENVNMEDNSTATDQIGEKDVQDYVEFFHKKEFVNLKKYIPEITVQQTQMITEDESIPPPVKDVSLDDPGIGDRLNIFWEKISYPNVEKIRIYRFEDAEGSGKLISELKISRENFTDKGLETGKIYYYLVKTVNKNNQESTNAEKYSLAPKNIMPPGSPSDIKIKQQGDKIELSWTNPEDNDLAYVYIYKSENQSMLGALSQTLEARAGQKLIWTDSSFTSYKEYYYSLAAVDNAGNVSPYNIIKIGNDNLFIIKDSGGGE